MPAPVSLPSAEAACLQVLRAGFGRPSASSKNYTAKNRFLGGNRGRFAGEPTRVVGCAGARGLLGGGSPDGTTKYASATRIAVKPCACGAPLRGLNSAPKNLQFPVGPDKSGR
jgi:hypothetical protein